MVTEFRVRRSGKGCRQRDLYLAVQFTGGTWLGTEADDDWESAVWVIVVGILRYLTVSVQMGSVTCLQ